MTPVPLLCVYVYKSVCVCACVSPLIKPVSGLVIKMHYHPTVSREETNSLSLGLLSLSHSYSLFHILPDSISSGKCRGGGHGGGSLSFFSSCIPPLFLCLAFPVLFYSLYSLFLIVSFLLSFWLLSLSFQHSLPPLSPFLYSVSLCALALMQCMDSTEM